MSAAPRRKGQGRVFVMYARLAKDVGFHHAEKYDTHACLGSWIVDLLPTPAVDASLSSSGGDLMASSGSCYLELCG